MGNHPHIPAVHGTSGSAPCWRAPHSPARMFFAVAVAAVLLLSTYCQLALAATTANMCPSIHGYGLTPNPYGASAVATMK